MPELPPAPAAGPALRCMVCGRTNDVTNSTFLKFARNGYPWCCGEAMVPLPLPGSSCDSGSAVQKRLCLRKPARHGAQLEFRRGLSGLGPNLGVELVDVSEDGLCLHVKESVNPGDEVEVAVGRPLGGKLHKRHARVRWCRAAWGAGFLVEVVFAKKLSIVEVAEVAT